MGGLKVIHEPLFVLQRQQAQPLGRRVGKLLPHDACLLWAQGFRKTLRYHLKPLTLWMHKRSRATLRIYHLWSNPRDAIASVLRDISATVSHISNTGEITSLCSWQATRVERTPDSLARVNCTKSCMALAHKPPHRLPNSMGSKRRSRHILKKYP